MIHRKGKFTTFLFSLLPGLGHMYLGFMKQGLSILMLFFSIFFVMDWLNIGAAVYFIPIIWLYSFFDALNKNALSDADFLNSEDHFIFNLDENSLEHFNFEKYRQPISITFILLGLYMVLTNLSDIFIGFLPDYLQLTAYRIIRAVPQLAFAVLIILIGIHLITKVQDEPKQIEQKEQQNIEG